MNRLNELLSNSNIHSEIKDRLVGLSDVDVIKFFDVFGINKYYVMLYFIDAISFDTFIACIGDKI